MRPRKAIDSREKHVFLISPICTATLPSKIAIHLEDILWSSEKVVCLKTVLISEAFCHSSLIKNKFYKSNKKEEKKTKKKESFDGNLISDEIHFFSIFYF